MNHEARAISALLINEDISAALSEGMQNMLISHKDIWEFIFRYYKTNRAVPPISVVIEQFPTFEFESDLEGATRHYAQRLREERASQELDRMIKGAAEALASKEGSAQDILVHFGKRLSEIQRATGISRSIDMRDIDSANAEFDRIRELAALHDGQVGIPTGFTLIDENYPTGMSPGHFIVGLGYSGGGKTWFILKLAINAWEQGYSPLIINLEMSPEELRHRILFLISQYSMDDLVKAQIDPESFNSWAKEYMENKVAFHLVGNQGYGSFTTDMVAGKIEQYKPDIVYLDYMQLFTDRAQSTQEVSRAKNTARELKELAMATDTPIVVVSAVTGKDKKERLVPPSIAQVAWSSEIEYAANLAFAVHTYRDPITQVNGNTQILLLKNRHGKLATFDVRMDLDNGVIEEIPDDEQLTWADDDNLSEVDKLLNEE